ncbi:MAG: hypothetical protein ACK5XX_01005 [Holosporales bacterium]
MKKPKNIAINGIEYAITGINIENGQIMLVNQASLPKRCSTAALQKKVATYNGKQYRILDAILDKHPTVTPHVALQCIEDEKIFRIYGAEINRININIGNNCYFLAEIGIRGCLVKGIAPEQVINLEINNLHQFSFQAYIEYENCGHKDLTAQNLICNNGTLLTETGESIQLSRIKPTYTTIIDELTNSPYVIDTKDYMAMLANITRGDTLEHLKESFKANLTEGSEIVETVLESLRKPLKEILILEYTIGDPTKLENNRVLLRLMEIAEHDTDCIITIVTSETASLHKPAFRVIAKKLIDLGINLVVPGIQNDTILDETPLYLTRTYGILNHAKAWVTIDKDDNYSGAITTACVAHSSENKMEATVILEGEPAKALAQYAREIAKNELVPEGLNSHQFNSLLLKNGIVTTSLRLSNNSYASAAYEIVKESRHTLFLFLKELSYGPILDAIMDADKRGVNITLALRNERSLGVVDALRNGAKSMAIISTRDMYPRHHANIIIGDDKGLIGSAYPAQYCIYQQRTLARSEDLCVSVSNTQDLQAACEAYLAINTVAKTL